MRWPTVTLILLAVCVVLGVMGGCAPRRYIRMHSLEDSEAVVRSTWKFESILSDRSVRTLRRHDLDALTGRHPAEGLVALRRECDQETTPDLVFAFAELAYQEAMQLERSRPRLAAEMYIASAQYAYSYLFAPKLASLQNEFDPTFREACLFYNRSVERLLRLASGGDGIDLQPGQVYAIALESGTFRIRCDRASGFWNAGDLERFHFAADYEICGLSQEYRQSGLGVPLIATRRDYAPDEERPAAERYCPPRFNFAMSAFLRLATTGTNDYDAVLELHDPLVSDAVQVAQQRVPLETDLTTPFAYYLAKNSSYANAIRLVGFFRPDKVRMLLDRASSSIAGKSDAGPELSAEFSRLLMQQPYRPDKIPVVFVHGLGSSPLTWVEMASSLQGERDIRDRYQFWFFFYPTGQPFWASAAQLRRELAAVRDAVDPQRQSKPFDEMVLVGHSMGGLLSRMQTFDSGDELWKLVSPKPFDEVTASLSPETRAALRSWFFFDANRSVRRVISIATPFHGSDVSNNATQWLVGKTIKLPHDVDVVVKEVAAKCPDLPADSLLQTTTSVASMATKSAILPKIVAMANEQTAASGGNSIQVASRGNVPLSPRVVYHNIVGIEKRNFVASRIFAPSDGVVPLTSAHLPGAVSEVKVVGTHQSIHDEPQTVKEVRRVLKMR